MAERLKRQYSLVALKVWLETGSNQTGSTVHLTLEAKYEGSYRTLLSWTLTTSEIGLPDYLDERDVAWGHGIDFHLPESLIEALATALPEVCTNAECPLWLHLVKPYGYLGLVPWEQLLSARLDTPILRLPDFIVPPPVENRRTLDVVLCAGGNFEVAAYAWIITEAALSSVPRQVRVHIFVDAPTKKVLCRRLAQAGISKEQVPVYAPNERATAGNQALPPHDLKTLEGPIPSDDEFADSTGRIANPWLVWIQDSLAGQSIDVVHFMCHGYYTNDRGALVTGEFPAGENPPWVELYIEPPELVSFLTQMGAWALVVSSPPNNFSDIGTRALVDGIGQMRPGSVLYHSLETDSSVQDLAGAYRFLFSPAPEWPPTSPSLFMYCQPHRVVSDQPQAQTLEGLFPFVPSATQIADMLPSGTLLTKQQLPTGEISDQEGMIPSWVAASQRYIEQAEMEVGRKMRATRPGQAVKASLNVEADTLHRLQELVADLAKETKSRGDL